MKASKSRDVTSSEFKATAHGFYAELRRKEPVYPRFYSPVEVATERYAREPLEVAGVTIPKDALVGPVLASANRDENHFERPDELDVGREGNRHLAFGDGMHFCLGAPLARLEGRIALERLLSHSPNLRLAVPFEELRWKAGLNLRGLEKLPVTLG